MVVSSDDKFYVKAKEPTKYQTNKKRFDHSAAPKMFYTPDEYSSEYTIVDIMFYNSMLFSQPKIYSKIRYLKMYFKNCKYPYIFVMSDMSDLFLKIYLDKPMWED